MCKVQNTCDGEFTIDAKLVLDIDDGYEIQYQIVKVPQTKKRYKAEEIDFSTYINDSEKTVFLARVGDQIAGQIILRKNWNEYAYIEDIAVDIQFRRQGMGEKLISKAKQWARGHNLPGIMLETQNNNVGACKFYEKCGFRLGGFDKYLYKGINRDTKEIALYWYLLFDDTLPNAI